jgi:predicted ATPase
VLLIVTYRTEDASSPLVAAMRADDGRDAGAIQVREIDVGALEPEDARRLALVLLGKNDAVSHARASIVATESRGNPFFVEELVRHVTDGQELASLGTASAVRLDDVLYGRVQELPEDARRLLEVIAVAGAPLARPVAAAATELDGEREATALAVLRAAKLVRSRRSQDQYELETYHDRIRETVTARLDAAARSRLHLRVAHALVARGNADPEALVVHFQEGKDGRKAAEFAARAAEKAVEALAFERAASLWRSALDLPSISPDAARALRRKLGDALNHRA